MDAVAAMVAARGASVVVLQFSARELRCAAAVVAALRPRLGPSVLLRVVGGGDEGCCCCGAAVSAARVGAQCVVHFGATCGCCRAFAPLLLAPPLRALSPASARAVADAAVRSAATIVLLDRACAAAAQEVRAACPDSTTVCVQQQSCSGECSGDFAGWKLPAVGDETLAAATLLVVSDGVDALQAAALLLPWARLFGLDPFGADGSSLLAEFPLSRTRVLGQRSRAVAAARAATHVGVVATAPAWLDDARRAVAALRADGRSCTLIALARPDETRLGNFPQAEAFAIAACPFTTARLLADSARRYHVPVVSVAEILANS